MINPLAISASLTGVIDKTYDGTTAATLGSGNYQLAGVIAGDTVGLTAASGAYDTKNVGTGKAVTFTGLSLTGADALDYTVYPVVSGAVGQIDPLALGLSVSGVIEKTYDGTTAATLGDNNYTLTGVISGDSVTLIDPTGATYATKDAGTGKVVNFTGLSLSGPDAGNYTVATSASAPIGIIDPLAITASLSGVVDKTYDGTTAATLGSGNYQLAGVIAGDTVGLTADLGRLRHQECRDRQDRHLHRPHPHRRRCPGLYGQRLRIGRHRPDRSARPDREPGRSGLQDLRRQYHRDPDRGQLQADRRDQRRCRSPQ